ncbi:PREDICTED: suppressor protein SRP40-like isoform X2 [Lupinus angustifolius]|uniref:suppressor protein SRP40-like isoform X2 n=1 Tax=Lupinus angustifolius TaxID=3871 RepID=UPI00092FC004|nr:PREDICTED: suppressor protein SRP40-like isoform X2 [Lupinus angustifolius]
MPATPSGSTIIAFTPRQVLLSNQTMKNIVNNGTLTLEPEQKLLLNQSIAHYLHHNGFSKSLKKFRSEAKIEKDNLEASSIDLEEVYHKYLEIRAKDTKSSINDEKEQATDVSKNKEEGKSKEKKKKSKIASESHANDVEDNQSELPTLITEKKVKGDVSADANVVNGAKTEKKSKDKKKKKDKKGSQGDAVKQIEDTNDTDSKKDKELDQEVGEEKKKDSKKRKRSTSEENDQNVADRKDDETKRKKVENLNADLGSDVDQLQKTPNQQANGKTNGHLESAGEKLSVQKSLKSQEKGSEQKTAKKAFQRVQADKVEFADERLQDNSYWAKDGAESGYGAKAQEILGQVRGRDFRHEKTKKKRGTYRGGQIDLYSHSVKFNYSDEE